MKLALSKNSIAALIIQFVAASLISSVQAQALKNDFLIHSFPFFENTAKVIPPGPGCPQGKIVIATGQPRDKAKLLHRPLYDNSGNIDTVSPTAEIAYPIDSTKAIATDNQIVRLKDGSLLAVKVGFVWDPINHFTPKWFSEVITGSGDHKGQRIDELVFRSTDCGNSWTLQSVIDFGLPVFLGGINQPVKGGIYGFPRPMDNKGNVDVPISQQGKHPNGSLMWFPGGDDRPEVYACPFTGNIYLTTNVTSGPYKEKEKIRTALLLYSKDNGQNWEVIKEDLPAWTPIVMTSTPNGRLFLFQCIGALTQGDCPAGGVHDGAGSFNYSLQSSPAPGQHDWRYCKKCQGLFFGGAPSQGICPAGGTHDGAGSWNYSLQTAPAPGQHDWRYCKKCQGLFFGGAPSQGVCPAGGTHDGAGSWNYSLQTAPTPGQHDWRYCKKCQGMFFASSGQPTVYFSKAPVNAAQKPEISPGYPVYYVEKNGAKIQNATAMSKKVDIHYIAFHPSISRISTDMNSNKARLAYHTVNTNGMQESPVVMIDVQNPDQAPVVAPVRNVRAENPKDYSVLYFNFIDPDYIDMPAGVKSNTSVAYWIEVPKPGLTNKKYAIRYMVFEGDYNTSCPAYLSVKDGQPKTWSTRQDLGDYMTGGFYWKNNTLNYLAQWVEPTGIRANVVTLPYQPPSGTPTMTVTAAWQPGNDDEVQVYGWKYEDFRKKYDDLWKLGWRLHILKNHVVNNQVLYTAVWRRATSGEIQVYGWAYTDFRKKYDELWNKGWRLHILNNYVVNSQVLYTAVWRPSTSGEIQVYGWAYADFRKKYDELWNKGWRLHILSNYVVNGQVLYTAVWRPSTSGEIQVYDWAYEDFRKKYDELWGKGWRLHILNNYVVNGQVRYTAVWRPGTSGEIQLYGWAYEDFRKKYDELWCDGLRLKILNVY